MTNFEIMPQPPEHENKMLTWPNWPLKLRTSSSHEEGAERDFAVLTTHFTGANGAREDARIACASTTRCKPVPGHRVRDRRPISCCWRWASCTRCTRAWSRRSGSRSIQRGNVAADDRRLSHLARQGVRRRRHAPRPVAGGVGDPRRPPGRARGRQVPDGLDDAAALTLDRVTASNGHHRRPDEADGSGPRWPAR